MKLKVLKKELPSLKNKSNKTNFFFFIYFYYISLTCVSEYPPYIDKPIIIKESISVVKANLFLSSAFIKEAIEETNPTIPPNGITIKHIPNNTCFSVDTLFVNPNRKRIIMKSTPMLTDHKPQDARSLFI